MMIAKDNWKWMPVRQASRLTERQDDAKIKDRRLLARTQFGKRLLLLPCVEASEVIPPEEDDEDGYTERGVSRDPMATTRMLDQEEKEDALWIESTGRTNSVGRQRCTAEGPRTEEGLGPGGQGPGR